MAFAARLFGRATLGMALLPVGLLLHVGYVTAATVAAAVLNILAIHILYGVFLWAGSWLAFRGTAPGQPSSRRSLAADTTVARG